MDGITGLEQAYAALSKLSSGLSEADLKSPTPCGSWDVRALLNHTLGAAWMFTLVNQGSEVGEDAGDVVGDDAAAAVSEASSSNLASWRQPGALDGDRSYPFGSFPASAALMINVGEIVVHSWDLARSTGQDATIDPDLATLVYEFYRPIPLDEYRAHGAFGPEIPVPDSAPVAERMLGLLGRSV